CREEESTDSGFNNRRKRKLERRKKIYPQSSEPFKSVVTKHILSMNCSLTGDTLEPACCKPINIAKDSIPVHPRTSKTTKQ
ncbi:hypothetical protein ACUX4R_28295, partial [Salmonella enterica]